MIKALDSMLCLLAAGVLRKTQLLALGLGAQLEHVACAKRVGAVS